MPIVPCPTGDDITIGGWNLTNASPTRTQQAFTTATQHSGTMFWQSSVSMTDGRNLGPNFVLEFWLCSGRGGTAVNELRMVNQRGAQVGPHELVTSWGANLVLPSVNRPFNWATDSFRWITAGGQDATSGQALFFDTILCQSGVSGDCCAETLSKLDEILGFVSRTWPVVPA